MKVKIENEQQIFDILCNSDNYKNLESIIFDEKFLNSIAFSFLIKGKTNNNIVIQGHITADILNICNAWQNAIYNAYASIVKGKIDARGKSLTEEERQKLALVFKIEQGSTIGKVDLDSIKGVLQIFSNMDKTKALALLATISIISSGWFIYLTKSNNNDKEKFLAQHKTIDKAIQELREVTIFALNSSRLNIEEATFGQETLNKNQIQEIYESIKNQKTETEKEKLNQNFIVKKLDTINNKKIVTLKNDEYEFEVDFVRNLFENNEDIFWKSYSQSVNIGCEILIEKELNGSILKATVISVKSE